MRRSTSDYPAGNTIDAAADHHLRSERNVLRGLVQQPLIFWPNGCMLRDDDFREYRALFSAIRKLICSSLLEGREQSFSEQLLNAVIAEIQAGVPADNIGTLFESFHESKFVESVMHLRGGRLLTAAELELQGKVARQCESIRETSVGVRSAPDSRSFAGIDASQLASYATQEADWLVQDVFTIDEPLLVGARSKGCKTLQLTDLAVAVASGTSWMNKFIVLKRRKVLFISGETNRRRIAKHIEKACVVRNLDFDDIAGQLRIEAVDFPCLPRLADQESIRVDIDRHEIELVIIDPLYRGLSGLDSSRLSEMGDAIKSFQAACMPACMVLSHHVVKSAAREYGNPPQLEDMTGAGIAESCGQWWLVGRNTQYEWDAKHDLCVQFGGREGQGGGRRILFNENDWTFMVDTWHDYTKQAQTQQQQKKDDARRAATEKKRAKARALILKAARNFKIPQSKNTIEQAAGAVQSDFRFVFAEMVRESTFAQRPYRDALNRYQPVGYLLNEYVADYDNSGDAR